MSSDEEAIVEWINTFTSLPFPCNCLSDLSDGRLLSLCLHEISPLHFVPVTTVASESESASNSGSSQKNWVLAAGNIRALMGQLIDYYEKILNRNIRHVEVSANAIAKDDNAEEILNLVELVVGVAVMCYNKASFISTIFELDASTQAVLKGLIERVMGIAVPIDTAGESSSSQQSDDAAGTDDNSNNSQGDDSGNKNSMNSNNKSSRSSNVSSSAANEISDDLLVRHLQDERQSLVDTISTLENENSSLRDEVNQLKDLVLQLESEKMSLHEGNALKSAAAATSEANIQIELDEIKRELDLKVVEAQKLTADLKNCNKKLDAAKEFQARLEMEVQQMTDELDVARDKAVKLQKAELQLEKYQRRLEELPSLKKENKELSEKMDKYLDKIHELESSNKGISTLNKMIEQYQSKAVELEREKFELISEIEMQKSELTRIKAEVGEHLDARRFLEEEMANMQAKLDQYDMEASENKGRGADGLPRSQSPSPSNRTRSSGSVGGGPTGLSLELFEETETVAQLKEKIAVLQRELRDKKNSESSGGGSSEADPGLKAELEDALKVKDEREQMLLATKKQLLETQVELSKTVRALHESETERSKLTNAMSNANNSTSGGGGAPAGAPTSSSNATHTTGSGAGNEGDGARKDLEHRLALSTNTVRLLEDKLKEKEGMINKLVQEKEKVENFARSSIITFKERHLENLQTIRNEKKALEAKIAKLCARHDRDLETSRREERLLLSAMYEVGVRIIDKAIEDQVMEPKSNTTFLGGMWVAAAQAEIRNTQQHEQSPTPRTPFSK